MKGLQSLVDKVTRLLPAGVTEKLPSIQRWTAVIALTLVLLGGAAYFVSFYEDFYPIKHWLFWRYAAYWVCCAFWTAGCVGGGYAIVRRAVRSPLPLLETAVLSFSAGVVLFYVAMNVVGALGGFRTATFFVVPIVMFTLGAPDLWHVFRRWRRHTANKKARAPSAVQILVWLFGLAGLVMIYMKIFTPENVQFDARWKHLALAEQYAHIGVIPRYGEGWTVATNPHLATIVFTWAFLAPGAQLFDQVEMAAHMELVCFLWSLAGISALVRLLVPGVRAHSAWAVRFLFPGVFLYDSSLSGGADHIAALFAAPVFIVLLRSVPRLEPGRCALLGIMMAGAAMPKLTAGMLIIPAPALVVAVVAAFLTLRGLRRRTPRWYGPLLGAFAGGAVALAATSPFWLRNWIWYGDPLYPSLHKYLALRPWTEDAADLFAYGYKEYQFWRPERSVDGLLETGKALFNFSFVPNDYARFHGKVPVFGSLMTLLLPCLLFLRRTKRIWALVGMVHLAVFVWYWVHHQDRYLQAILPWMAAIVAAIIIRLWQTHAVVRVGVATLVATQIVIGGNVYFIQTHAMVKKPLDRTLNLLASGYKRDYVNRLNVFSGWVKIREALPPDAHVMLHDNHVHLGLARRTASDWGGWQFGLSYGRLHTPRAVWDAYREIGVTHVVWADNVSKGWDSVGGDLVFFDFAMRHTTGRKKVGSTWVASMPTEPPPAEPAGPVAIFGCGDYWTNGLYRLADLTTPVFGPKRDDFAKPIEVAGKGQEARIAKKASFLVIDPACANSVQARVKGGFQLVAKRTLVNSKRKRGRKSAWLLYLRSR